jgi:PKD repeat protein
LKTYLFLSASTLLAVAFFVKAQAQLPVANFSAQPNACLNERLNFTNTSTNASKYEWDFCEGDLFGQPFATGAGYFSGAFNPKDMDIKKYGDNWYGFVTSRSTNSIYKVNYGTNLSNQSPAITNLGNLGSLLSGPEPIKIIEENGNWFGLIANAGSSTLIRLSFGSDLDNNQPISETVFGGLDVGNNGMDVGISSNGIVAVIANTITNKLSIINFGNSIQNNPLVSDVITTAAIVGSASIDDITLLLINGNWFGFLVAAGSYTVHRLDFGSNLFSIPNVVNIVGPNFMADERPYGIQIKQDKGSFVGFIQTYTGPLYRLDFGSVITDNTPVITKPGNLGSLANSVNLELVKENSNWYGFVIDVSNLTLNQIVFPNTCSANKSTSLISLPSDITYSSPGPYYISLTVSDQNGNSDYRSISISISGLQSPDITFTTQNICANSNVNFTSQNISGNITGYAWDFGDTKTSPQPNPSNVYALAGIYPVTLQVTASNGCINTAKSDIAIYSQPTADFLLPPASPFCTNQNYKFTNQSTFDPASNPTWEWRLNGVLVSGALNLTQPFTTASAQEIRLKSIIPGCENEIIKNVTTVLPGPLTNFTFANGCQGSPIPFTITTVYPATVYAWAFGDGNTSASVNSTNTYTNIGTFNVTLQANNADGCQNSLTKPLTIYTTPQPNFSIGLPPFSCERSPSQFTDLTPSPTDSNIASWAWSFGDAANGASTFKNPTYTYSTANNYNVSLMVGTNFGCTNTIQKSVTIASSPVANFTNLPACVNQATQFTDASTGSIKSRLWQIQSSTFTTPSPQFTFSGSGSFPVLLTVTGNNNCVNQLSKSINVPIPPSLDFSVQAPCVNNSSIFTEITNATDPSVAQAWAFGSQANGSGNPVQYSFATPNNYLVRLSSTRQSGCVYSLSKNVSILDSPVADFAPSVDAGAAPLSVSFSNNSSLASSYLWRFGDAGNSTSSIAAPSFLFTELGDYTVELTAANTVGCSSQLRKAISVVVPRIDAVMEDFFFIKDATTGALQAVVRVLNNSNVSLTNPAILIDVTGGSLIKEKINGILKPKQEITQLLDLQIIPRSVSYACAEVVALGDVDLFQNKKCLSLAGEEVLFSPYPNPAQAELNLDWISAEGSPVSILITNSTGSVSLQQTFSNILTGLNRLIINTSGMASGVYYIRFSDNKTTKSFGFAVAGN